MISGFNRPCAVYSFLLQLYPKTASYCSYIPAVALATEYIPKYSPTLKFKRLAKKFHSTLHLTVLCNATHPSSFLQSVRAHLWLCIQVQDVMRSGQTLQGLVPQLLITLKAYNSSTGTCSSIQQGQKATLSDSTVVLSM